VSKTEPVDAEVVEPAPMQAEADEPEPVEAEMPASQPVLAAAEEPAPSPLVEWRAPSEAPAAASSPASDGNGIPPAPADDARYDDIWTAAFAPPGPEPSQENGGSHTDAAEASHTAPTEQPAHVVDPSPEPPVDDAAPDDLPSTPEDQMSAEDEMWSLRARLADAAARKKQIPHQLD
jgi:hypothetical protein